jgi:hypothetical protein
MPVTICKMLPSLNVYICLFQNPFKDTIPSRTYYSYKSFHFRKYYSVIGVCKCMFVYHFVVVFLFCLFCIYYTCERKYRIYLIFQIHSHCFFIFFFFVFLLYKIIVWIDRGGIDPEMIIVLLLLLSLLLLLVLLVVKNIPLSSLIM